MYWHEQEERKPNVHPMCTSLPSYAVIQSNVERYLSDRYLNAELAFQNGWYESWLAGDNYQRCVIPAVTHKVGHVYWQARDITGRAYIRYQSPKGPRHEALVVVKPFESVKGTKGVVVVEGPTDALSAAGEGYVGIALMGMQPSQATLMHLALILMDYSNKQVLVLLDRDSGANASKVALFLSTQGYHARIDTLPGPEKDLAACLPPKRKKILRQSFQKLFQSKSSRKGTRTGKHA